MCCSETLSALELEKKQPNLLQKNKHSREQKQPKAPENDQAEGLLAPHLLIKEEVWDAPKGTEIY